MKFVQHSVRLPLALDKALRHESQRLQVSPYALLQKCVQAGLSSLSGEQAGPQLTAEIAREIGTLAARLAHVERLTERTLFVACAAYTYARAAAGPSADQSTLTQAIQDAFTRQINLAGDS
ncbi:hypothetical protein [Acidiphilium iwatense]|uniref:Uncharacterized protein n=1 Tax=Acidiphilium iwatense TaxID=768198 RepID=A0ABS9E1C6_9PROT|nr:hypothetical protein [Acidiphilium iwatense]MCF3948802.1 hypothetical protein [Acidiphilium iwatense]